ncbi:MAG: transcription-repair coupling factor [Chloroflexota bacterium]
MDLSSILGLVRDLPAYQRLLVALQEPGAPPQALRLPRAARPALAAALALDLQRPVLLLVSRADRMLTLTEELPAWSTTLRIYPFPDPRPLFYEFSAWGPRTLTQRLTALTALAAQDLPPAPTPAGAGSGQLVLAPARAAMTRTLARRDFAAGCRWLEAGASIRLDRLLQLLLDVGYQPETLVTEPGQFSHRGGILDLWPPAEASPVRLELFGDEIDSLRHFDPSSQRSTEAITHLLVTPAREALPRLYQESWDDLLPPSDSAEVARRIPLLESFLPLMNPPSAGLADFLPRETLVLFEDLAAFSGAVEELEEQAVNLRREQVEAKMLPPGFPLPYLTWPELHEALTEYQCLDLGYGEGTSEGGAGLEAAFAPAPRFGGQVRPLLEHLAARRQRHESAVIVSRQAPRLAELWAEHDAHRSLVERVPADIRPGDVVFLRGALSEGWELSLASGSRFHLLTDAEIFGWGRPRPRPPLRVAPAAPEAAYADLRPGDWVVHVDYGLGQFGGLVERTLDGLQREFLMIAYAEGDQLYVPIHQADRVTRYVGVDDAPPTPSRLGTQEWERVKGRARESAEQVARELLELYARRMAVTGHAFSPDTAWQRELEASFPYVETEDQLRSIEAVKVDMERPRPMDRLICGDVGYGKTEVALRAAFKAVMDGKQAAVLVPTTVLAQQHFDTFRQRLAAYPVEVEMLSRFRTRAEADAILRRLAVGEIDIVIGTHRLLQHDVMFEDLGLLVIDEEQRFGVTHKEFLKQMRTEVDVLTLTATPIPRTLYMAVTGVRDISTINTPPEDRLPVITHIGPYDPRLIRQAVLREMDRNGQVFFVHNRVQTIEAMRARLQHLIPEARIVVGHGQLPEKELSRVMERFNAGEIDVLLSTSIIESGLDIPNANTLIVDRADTFGLAQLHQLRGRVGRGAARAYAYFFRHPRFRPTDEALQRLEVIAENTQLGSGYSIAMRDLEIRGAGDLLGTRQHGHIAAVGFHLYTRLLGQAVRRLKARRAAPELPAVETAEAPPVAIDLPVPCSIPADYVPDRDLRLQLYRRLADLREEGEIDRVRGEFNDRFGSPPEEVENLLYQLRVKVLATRAFAEAITLENGQVLIALPPESGEWEIPELGVDVRRSKRGLWLNRALSQDWRLRLLEVLEALGRWRASQPSEVRAPPPG